MDDASTDRVCPTCGTAPGSGTFRTNCGANLTKVDRLSTQADRLEAAWRAEARLRQRGSARQA